MVKNQPKRKIDVFKFFMLSDSVIAENTQFVIHSTQRKAANHLVR